MSETTAHGSALITHPVPYGFSVDVSLPYDVTVERTKAALAEQGFGVLTEIDVRATMRKKLDLDFRPYVILGACNPFLAHRALTIDREIGLLLPCNVVVYAGTEHGASTVSILDPVAALALTENEEIRPIAVEARARLERALVAIAAG